jgi:cobalt-zinc-cadmium efflux system outer membrane protein
MLRVSIALLICATAAYGEPRVVSLDDAIAAAKRAPATAIATHEVAAADALTDAAGAWPNPALRVETNRLTARLVTGVTFPLPIFGTVGAARDEASAHARVVRRDAETQQRELMRRAVLAWITLARADADIDVRATAATQAADLESLARGRLDAGAGAEVDVVSATAARARADVAVTAARHAQEAAAAALAGVLGWDPTVPLKSDGTFPVGAPRTVDELRAGLAKHPEAELARARIAEAHATVARTRKQRAPGVALEVQSSAFDPTQPGVDVLAALTLDLPVFAHVGDQVRGARATESAEQARAAATTAELDGELVAAFRRWQAASVTAESLEKTVLPAQERATQLAHQAYREGARDLSTALQADRDLASTRADLSAARGELAAAWIELELAAGEDVHAR